jgi:CheY-like chemotaxis protein
MNTMATRSLELLVVEDNPADVVFFREALEATQLPATVHVVSNGNEALKFLRRQARFADAPRPDVIVLDLNLPIRSGQEVLMEMASDPELNTMPVAILTTSTSEQCVCELYPQGRCVYFTKTAQLEGLQDIVRQIAAHAQQAGGAAL